MLCNVTVLTDQ